MGEKETIQEKLENIDVGDKKSSTDDTILPEVIVGERKDGSKAYALMNGNNIEELKYLYEYNSEEEALRMLEELKLKYGDIDFIKEIKLNGIKVEIIFKDEIYQNVELETIINKYF